MLDARAPEPRRLVAGRLKDSWKLAYGHGLAVDIVRAAFGRTMAAALLAVRLNEADCRGGIGRVDVDVMRAVADRHDSHFELRQRRCASLMAPGGCRPLGRLRPRRGMSASPRRGLPDGMWKLSAAPVRSAGKPSIPGHLAGCRRRDASHR